MSAKINKQYIPVVDFIRSTYKTDSFIPLHEPRFLGNEKKYLNECIDSTFVSSVGKFVDIFEEEIAKYTGAKYAVATSNGTSALHISLLISGVEDNHEVVTQPLTFIATCNAISYCNATPIFVDVDRDTMGMSPVALEIFLEENAVVKNAQCINQVTGKIIKACVPMHTFGHPCRIDEIQKICRQWHIVLIEDSAESLGSFYKGKHTGTFGDMGVLSFNGNKVITSGGGGCILTDDEDLAKKVKHLTTTAKEPHKWEYKHDLIGYNYRMPNLNAALIVAQLEQLNGFLKDKRLLSYKYKFFFQDNDISFMTEPKNSKSNYWLNAISLKNKEQRDFFLNETNSQGIMTRPIWTLMNKLPMFKDCQSGDIKNSEWLEDRVVNIPSSVHFNVKNCFTK
jgi:perosamine synthetase